MEKPARLKIHNWDQWQSYRNDRGQPPWIKIHRCLMREIKWVNLTDGQRGQLVSIWLLAADNDGIIPADPDVIKKLCFMQNKPDLNLFISLGFIDGDANVTSVRRQDDANVTHQNRIEENREEKNIGHFNGQKYFPDFWSIYPKKVKKKDSLKKWRSKHLDKIAHIIIQDIRTRLTEDKRWKDGYIPDPTTYLNGERWEDEITQQKKKSMTYDEEQRYIRTMMADLKKELEEDGHVYGAH